MDIILYLLHTIQDLYRQNCWLINFILCRYIPLKQWAFDDSHGIPEHCSCPSCGAPQPYLYRNNGKAGQLK